MMFFRNILFYIGVLPATFIVSVLAVVFFFMPLRFRYWMITRWSHFFIFWVKFSCNLSYRVQGLENLPNENAIVVSNHQSMWETIFFQVLLPPQTWILKRELLFIPFFGWGLWLLEPIAINRKQFQSVKELIRQGKKKLEAGQYLILFPESTRVPFGESRRFTRSAAALAVESGYPILPIAHNAGKFWPKGAVIYKSGIIDVIIGPLIRPQGKSLEELHQITESWVKNNQKIIG